jgi:hypothetical protein
MEVPAGPSDRNFGYTVGGILIAIAAAKWLWGSGSPIVDIVLVSIGSVLVFFATVAPPILAVPNRLWMKLGLLMFKVVNPVVMFLIYATTFVPIGLLLRLRGRDLLDASIDRQKPSYWLDREEELTPPRMTNQF